MTFQINVNGVMIQTCNVSIKFLSLFQAKNALTDPDERKYYDAWLDSGIAMSFKNWRGLKDTVKTSMHWAVPKTDRMIKKEQRSDGSIETTSITENPSQLHHDMLLPSNKAVIDGSQATSRNLSQTDKGQLENEDEYSRAQMGKEEDIAVSDAAVDQDDTLDDVVYEGVPYHNLGYRMESPPPEWKGVENEITPKKDSDASQKHQELEAENSRSW